MEDYSNFYYYNNVHYYYTPYIMISKLLLWLIFLIAPALVYYFYNIDLALVTGISISILLQIFANEEGRDIRERQIKFINAVCEKFKITIKD